MTIEETLEAKSKQWGIRVAASANKLWASERFSLIASCKNASKSGCFLQALRLLAVTPTLSAHWFQLNPWLLRMMACLILGGSSISSLFGLPGLLVTTNAPLLSGLCNCLVWRRTHAQSLTKRSIIPNSYSFLSFYKLTPTNFCLTYKPIISLLFA